MADNSDIELVRQILADHSKFKNDRTSFEEQWNEIIDRVLPRFRKFNSGHELPGQKRTQNIFDSTASMALRHFAAAFDSMITPRTQKYQRLTTSNLALRDNDNVKAYLEAVTDVQFSMRYRWRAGFTTQMGEFYVGQGAFGSSGLMIEDTGNPNQPVRYRNVRLSQLYFSEGADGLVDKAHMVWKLTARQAAQRWGRNALPVTVKNALDRNNYEQCFDFLHCVQPREQRDPTKRDSRNMRYQSVWICRQGDEIVEHGGFRTFPLAVGRFYSTDDSAYAYSPAMESLPDINMLNEMERTNIRGAQKLVDPPLLLPEDGVLEGFDLRSGALNYGGIDEQGRQVVQPLQLGNNVPLGIDYANQKRQAVNLGFYVTLFQIMVDGPAMTATEVLERAQEKGILLAPTMGRVQSETLGPLTERELDIAMSYGLLPPMPDELREAGADVEIEYDSPLNRAMRSGEASATLQWLGAIAPLAQIDPRVQAVPNAVEIARGLADSLSVPTKYLNTEDQTEADIAAQQQQAQAAELLQAAPIAAATAKDLTAATVNAQNAPI